MTDELLRQSATLSLSAQITLGAISCLAFISSRPWSLLFVSLILDTTVQLLEISYYAATLSIKSPPTYWRYADWFLSTPTMLLSFVMYAVFLYDRHLSLAGFFTDYGWLTVGVAALDVMMLIFGLLAEWKWIDRAMGVYCGLVPYVIMFTLVFVYVQTTPWGYVFLSLQAIVWGLYGLAAMLAYRPKNILYNLLDVLSKNVYGVVAMVTAFVVE